ncbi:unnamed protein product [Phytophthora lilii]|uniref:beta-glucosidase n=1 Tax=Phytophthora lilii TaxID=2077276 RepID=A0A9W6X0F6_9STRA|nr:unnamed protein product [Phytophthora lilii]
MPVSNTVQHGSQRLQQLAIVMSDWGATHSTAESIKAGMDVEMPGGNGYYSKLYDFIYESKNFSESYLNRALGHILIKYDDFGILGTTTAGSSPLPADVVEEHAQISYDIAVKSGILLRNNNKALPISKDTFIAVIGPNGVLPKATLRQGCCERKWSDQEGTIISSKCLRTSEGSSPGLARSDTNGGASTDETIAFNGSASLPGNATYTWQGQLYAEVDGYYTVSFARDIPYSTNHTNAALESLSTTGSLKSIPRAWQAKAALLAKTWSNAMATHDSWNNGKVFVCLTEGWHTIKASAPGILEKPIQVRLSWVTPAHRAANIEAAVDLAKKVDTPIAFGFAVSSSDGTMTLNDNIDELMSKVAAVNAKTVVVLNNAEPVTMPRLSSVSAVLEMMYPNQEGGLATADLLIGNRSPQGRVPVTYPTSMNTSMVRNPDYPERVSKVTGFGAGGEANFSEGLNNGYRWYLHSNTSVLFAFGYGLTYTSFDYSEFKIFMSKEAHHSGDGHYEVSCEPDSADAKISVLQSALLLALQTWRLRRTPVRILFKPRYEEDILKHSGIRIVEPELFDGYDPKNKMVLHQVAIDKKMSPIEVADREEALQFRKELGKENVDVFQSASGAWMIRLRKGSVLNIPRALNFDRFVAGQIPTGWSAERLGLSKDLADSVDPITLYVLASTMDAFVAAGVTDPYEFYQYVHVSEVGNTSGGGMGGMRAFTQIYKSRLLVKPAPSDALQECFINTPPAWVNMLLLSSSGPIKTPVGACATAAESVDIGAETIKSGKARICIVGGYDDFGEEGAYEFAQMKATSDSPGPR